MKASLAVGLVALAGCAASGEPTPELGRATAAFALGSSYEVTCVTRDRTDPDGRMEALGGPRFYEKLDNVISAVERGIVLYTKVEGRNANLQVVRLLYPPTKYLRTNADVGRNNLLNLPECQSI